MQSVSPVVRGGLAVTAWLVATVLAGTVAWVAVSRLGRPAGVAELRPLSPVQVRAQLAQPRPAPSAGLTVAPRTTDRSHRLGAAGVTRLAAPPKGISRSWLLAGGLVGVSCRGRAAHLLYAAPLNGWAYRLEMLSRSISVQFVRAAQTSGMRARCVRGVPARVTGTERERTPR